MNNKDNKETVSKATRIAQKAEEMFTRLGFTVIKGKPNEDTYTVTFINKNPNE